MSLAERFAIRGPLGQGGSSIVVIAEDRWRGQAPVVLKLLRPDRPELESTLRREFALLFRLRHPHIAQVLELAWPAENEGLAGAKPGAPFLVSERVPGVPAQTWASGRPLVEIADVGLQICAALACLHALGIHHGDLKPANILVSDTPAGPHAKLIDFGLAGRGPAHVAAGTPRFMAPEALAGRVDMPGDLYSLAATLVALATGAPPTGPLGGPLSCAVLAEVIAAMGTAEARQRVDCAAAFALLLAHTDERGRARAVALRDAGSQAPTLVGRQTLAEAAGAVFQGAGVSTLHVAGAPGDGCTAALAELLAQAIGAGLRVTAVRSAGDGSLRVLAESLRELGVSFHAELEADPQEGELRTHGLRQAQRAVEALALATQRGPTALFFDDVPANSPLDDLGAFLQRLGTRGPRVVWITSGAPRADARPAVSLAPLDLGEVREMIRLARPLRPHDPRAAEAVVRATGGHPADVVSLLAAFPGDALGRAATDGELERPAVLTGVRAQRVASLPAAERALLAALAWAEAPVPVTELDAPAPLAELVRRELVMVTAGTAAPRASVVSRVVAELARPQAGAEGERAALALLTRSGLRDSHAPALGRLLHHRGDRVSAGPLLVAGGQLALRELRLADAAKSYELALSCPLTSEVGDAVRLDLGRVLVAMGRGEAALASLSEADRPSLRRARVETLLTLGRYAEAAAGAERAASDDVAIAALRARALMLLGSHEEAQAVAEAALQRAPGDAAAARLTNTLGMVAYFRGDRGRARLLVEEAVRLAEAAGLVADREAAQANLALVLHKSGELAAAEALYRKSVAAARLAGDLPRQAARLTNLATLQQEAGRVEDALASYDEALYLTRLIDGRRDAVRVALNLANLLVDLGDAPRAEPLLEAAAHDASALGMHTEHGYLSLVAAERALLMAQPGAADHALAAARPVFSELTAGSAECDAVAAEIALFRRDLAAVDGAAARAIVAADAAGRRDVATQARLWRGLAGLDGALSTARRQQSLADLEEVARVAESGVEPDLGWLAHAALGRLHELMGRRIEADLHRATARQIYAETRSRLSSRYAASHRDVWYRRALALEIAVTSADSAPETRDLDRILAINRELASDRDPERLLERIIDAAIALSGAERGFIILKTDDAEGLAVRAARNFDRQTVASEDFEISRSIALQAMRSALPVSSLDAQGDDRFSAFQSVHVLKLRSILCLPLRSPDGVLGALYLDHRRRANAFTEADVAQLSAFADQAAIALANARLVAALKARSLELERSRLAIESLNQQLEREVRAQADELAFLRRVPDDLGDAITRHSMVGRSRGLREVCRIIDRVADKDVTVTILGESGTGKELVARAVHTASRRTGAFVSVNCGAIPAELLESELFGHERGAFTGAVRRKPGLFEVARGGTVLLDEIGDMPMAMQVKLLRVLQQKEFRRVGGTETLATDARVIAATHRDLDAMVRDGRFREDLWYRLNVVEIRVPPLRERRDDIPALIEHFVAAHGGKRPPRLERAALAALIDHDWPGNVRELENELQRALALADEVVSLELLSPKLRGTGRGPLTSETDAGKLRSAVEDFERDRIILALNQSGGRVAVAARTLGLTRAGLYKKMARYRIEPQRD